MPYKRKIEAMIKPKNIQLSEKVEYLLISGTLSSYVDSTRSVRHKFSSFRLNVSRFSASNERFIDFVNRIIKDNDIYPDVQNYILAEDKVKFISQ